jgi:uncharacterized repeat protein (TIGR04138 family)
MAVTASQSNTELTHPALQVTCYPPAAFLFVTEGLRYTTERSGALRRSGSMGEMGGVGGMGGMGGMGGAGDGLPLPDSGHVSGQQLCMGLREYAIDRFGVLAPCVLRHWNISRTEDFGRIVYALIEAGELSKTADDSIEDFHSVFEFDEAFSLPALSARIVPRATAT